MICWILALVITLGSAVYQRTTGPTYPVEAEFELGGGGSSVVLNRSHGGEGDQPVVVENAAPGVTGKIFWKRYKSRDEFASIEMSREGTSLAGALPHQPPAGKLEYYLELSTGGETIRVPGDRSIVTRFKGGVPSAVLIPHIIFIFSAMLVSNRAAIEAIRNGAKIRALTYWTVLFLLLGGFLFGPLVQKYAFGALWTGFPFGYDLTDNKTLIALVGWLFAIARLRTEGAGRWWVLGAAIVMIGIFMIPHSMLGSELKYE